MPRLYLGLHERLAGQIFTVRSNCGYCPSLVELTQRPVTQEFDELIGFFWRCSRTDPCTLLSISELFQKNRLRISTNQRLFGRCPAVQCVCFSCVLYNPVTRTEPPESHTNSPCLDNKYRMLLTTAPVRAYKQPMNKLFTCNYCTAMDHLCIIDPTMSVGGALSAYCR